ncbi:MAG: hypothetical protein ACRDHE_12575, partial [Ktedonobacterales bacterium]
MWTRRLGPPLLLLVVALAPAASAPRGGVSHSGQSPAATAAPHRSGPPAAPLLATHSRAQAVMSCQTPSAPSAVMDVKLLQQPFVLDGGPASCALLRLVIPAPAGGVPAVG